MTQLWIALALLGVFAALVLLTLWRIRADQTRAPDHGGPNRIFRPSSGMLSAALAAGVPGLGFLAAGLSADDGFRRILFLVPALILAVLCGTALLTWARFRVEIAPEGIALCWPVRGWRRWRWEALRNVRLERRGGPRGGAWLAAEAGVEQIRIPGSLIGFSDLVTDLLAEAERRGIRGADRDA